MDEDGLPVNHEGVQAAVVDQDQPQVARAKARRCRKGLGQFAQAMFDFRVADDALRAKGGRKQRQKAADHGDDAQAH